MLRLGERMTIKLRENIMFRGLQRGMDATDLHRGVGLYFFDRKHNIPENIFLSAVDI